MTLGIITLIGVIVGVLMVIQIAKETQKQIVEKIDSLKETILEPTKYVKGMGALTAGIVSFGMKQIFNKFFQNNEKV
jgi:hypothetical protein